MLRRIAGSVVLCGALLVSLDAHGAEFSQSWVSPKFAPCEGVGIAGSFRVHVAGAATPKQPDGSRTVTALQVHASSAAFTQGDGSIASKAIVRRAGGTVEEVPLIRPTPPSMEATRKPDESAKLYLPKDKTITVPDKAELLVSAAAVVKTPSGTCALGSSENAVKLP
jgi:hypothetical protein